MSRERPVSGLRRELTSSWRIVVIALALILGTSAASCTYLIAVEQPRLARASDIVRLLRLAHEGMLDQETGLRAYAATGERRFLQPYYQGKEATEAADRQLLTEIGDDEVLAGLLLPTMEAEDAWHEQWAQKALALPSGQPLPSSELGPFFAAGMQLFDSYRVPQLRAVAEAFRVRNHIDDRRRTVTVATGAFTTALVLLVLAADVRRRRRIVRLVDAPVRDLLTHIRRINDGDFTPPEQAYAVEEYTLLYDGLCHMAEALEAARDRSLAREAAAQALAERLAVIVRVTRDATGSLDVFGVGAAVVRAALEIGSERAVVWTVEDDGTAPFTLVALCSSDGPVTTEGNPPEPTPPALEAARTRHIVRGEHASFFPLVTAGALLGVLEVRGHSTECDDAANVELDTVLETLALTAASALHAAQSHARVTQQAARDALTGLGNRRRLHADAPREWERARRYGRPLSVCLLDIDHFKRVNDSAGHLVGDIWLREVAEVLTASLRDSDTAYRYGGEELLVVSPESDSAAAAALAERIRTAIEQTTGPASWPHLTASLGVASLTEDMGDLRDLIAAADRALYEAKRSGRNRVVVAGEDLAPAGSLPAG